jgi:altronate hydrolase
MVRRYGQAIGRARENIAAGSHVHLHNLGFEELELAYEFPEGDTPAPVRREDGPSFLGYHRADGRVGTRNYIVVVAASNCAAHTAEMIARSYEGETLPPNSMAWWRFRTARAAGTRSVPTWTSSGARWAECSTIRTWARR